MKETRDSIADIWGPRTPYRGEWPVRVDERTLEEPDQWVQSCCVLCSNGCGMDIGVKGGKIVGVRGRAVDRVNHGRLGPKGLNGWEANNSRERLLHPLVRHGQSFQQASWDEAMDLIVQRTKEITHRHTSGAIAFYVTGQIFIEEYYTLAIIGRGGLGTRHMDGNTRLCTATAGAALMESFGTDGQPGSYDDIDVTDAILDVGHNAAAQQTVLWMRILDRLDGPNPPQLIVIDPRLTPVGRRATVHIAPRAGTNVAVMNGLLNLMIQAGHVDQNFIKDRTVGFDQLVGMVSQWTPERVEQIAQVPAKELEAAAEILGTTPSLVSFALQGVYQSNQATASACQINNVHLLRGLIGRPGCGILQMNGQPTAQNTRETGCDGAPTGFRNWSNPKHVEELARLWNVDPLVIPSWAPPTHAMEIFRYAEEGSIKMLWIVCTNPAVSMPDLPRIRQILDKEGLFLVVQDAFMTETAEFADIVLPAAVWGEKTGTFTNTDRTVHISHQAVNPPGECRTDFDIFLDYARRMDLRDKDGAPLIKWTKPEEAFEAWKEATRGRPMEQTELTYAKLTGGSGIQWPCNEEHPNGTVRLYENLVFGTFADYAETYGHDLETGSAVPEQEYRANDPHGRAIFKAADYIPPSEEPDKEYPFWLVTGRVVYHFHTRTKTARAEELIKAAPDAFVQLNEEDAAHLGIRDGDMVEVTSRRGVAQAPAVVGSIIPGHVFIPFHYGYWDNSDRPRAANELTVMEWDPVSKQPHFKFGAVRIRKLRDATPEERQRRPQALVIETGQGSEEV